MKIALLGCYKSESYRKYLTPLLKCEYYIPCFTKDFTPDKKENEVYNIQNCDYILYCITNDTSGYISVVELMESLFSQPEKTLYTFIDIYYMETDIHEMSHGKERSCRELIDVVKKYGGKYFTSLNDIAAFLNEKIKAD